MKKRNVFVRVFAATMAAVLLLSGCGETNVVSNKEFATLLETELGNPPDAVSTFKAFAGEAGSEDVWLSGVYKAKMTDADEMTPATEYVANNLEKRDYRYLGCYVMSKDFDSAEQMRLNYGAELEKAGWTRIDDADYLVTSGDSTFEGSLFYVKGNNAVWVRTILGPLHWEEDKVLKNTTEDYYGTTIYYY